ncbi:15603_t:CDS:2 [Acaulospora colombiana]|uniref:15603_t:CDS:1 n=1 Tax=Acaulospora colombiana TaxID=27376 RepID=A0ACA9MDF6_9GLOM|nr:15603_t:CDS:2 [Acaulospora colombiana]
MEGVETTEVAMPSAKEIKKWSPQQVLEFLEKKKDELFLKNQHIKIIEDQEISGQAFLDLTQDDLMNVGMTLGPTKAIIRLVKKLNGEEQVTLKRKHEESEDLSEILKTTLREEFTRQFPAQIPVSELSGKKMEKIMSDIGMPTIEDDFESFKPVSCTPFDWDLEMRESQQMTNVVIWLQNALALPKGLRGGDITIGPTETPCVWFEIKKTPEAFKEAQAIGKLFLLDSLSPLHPMVVLTDCNDHWSLFFFEKLLFVTNLTKARINHRGTALAVIRQFVLEEASVFYSWRNKRVNFEAKPCQPLEKKAKFIQYTPATEDRMAELVDDMSEQELFNMTARKRLKILRNLCRLDELPYVDQLIGQFSDDYEYTPPQMYT